MGVQPRLVEAGVAKQSGKGSAAVDPEYAFGVLGGAVVQAEASESDLDPTSASSRILEGRQRTLVVPGAAYQAVAMDKSIGRLLLAATGSVSTTGTGPYTHTFTEGTDLPYHTIFADFDGEFTEVVDAKADELELSFDQAAAAQVSVTWNGLTATFDAGAYTATTTERAEDPLRAVGGTLNVDGAAAQVQSAAFTVSNSLEAIGLADAVTPDDVFPGRQNVAVSVTLVPDNLDQWQEFLTGSATGTSISDDVDIGSVDMTLQDDAGNTLQFDADAVAFTVSGPEADPSGAPAQLELEGVVTRPSSGDPYQFVLTNDESSY